MSIANRSSLLDRFNTALPVFSTPDSNRTAISSTTPTPSPSPLETQTAQSSSPTPSSHLLPIAQSNNNNDLTLKVALGAGLGGAAILSLIALYLFLRHRNAHRSPVAAQRDSGVAWDGHSMSTSPSDPKRYFVNNGSVQMRDRESVSSMGMVPVTNLEIEHERDAATRYHYQGKRGQPVVPVRSPSRINRSVSGSGNGSYPERPERSYF